MNFPKRGRPAIHDRESITEKLLQHREEIINPAHKIVSKSNDVWRVVANELQNKVTALSLYAIVTCNKYGIRDKLRNPHFIEGDSIATEYSINNSMQSNNISNNSSFTISVPESGFDDLLTTTIYKRNESAKCKKYERKCTVLEPGKWQHFLTTHLWNVSA